MQERRLQRNEQAKKPMRHIPDIIPSERPKRPKEGQERLNFSFFDAASMGNNAEIMRLIKQGADIAAKDPVFGETALHKAANSGNPKTCILIIEEYAKSGGDVMELIDIIDKDGWTVLQRAAWNGHTETKQLFGSIEKLGAAIGKEMSNSFMKSFAKCLAA